MKKTRAIHPFLFAIYPVLELFYKLSPEVVFRDTLRALILLLAFTGLLFIGLGLWLKDWGRGGFLTTLLLFGLVYYGSIQLSLWESTVKGVRLGRHEIFFPFWVFLLVGMGSSWRWLREPTLVTKFFNIMAVAAVLLSSSRYVLRQQSFKGTDVPIAMNTMESAEELPELAYDYRPDIYYIILDGYARGDVLQILYDFDNSEFLEALTARGFYVASESRSNYVQTLSSLSASLNLRYIDPQIASGSDRGPLVRSIQNSTVRRLLEDIGYQLVVSKNSYNLTSLLDADVSLEPETVGKLNIYEEMFLMQTSASILVSKGYLKTTVSGYDYHRALTVYALEKLSEVPALAGSKFVFYHIIVPHPPFVLDRNGTAVIPDAPFWGVGDGDHFIGGFEAYRSGYCEVLPYLNRMILHAIDEILTQSSEPPIIILQADHGPGSLLNWESPEQTCHWERTAILNAYYLPEGGTDLLYPEITPVNTFRVIFDTYFGTDFGLLEDRNYYSRWSRPYDFLDVTEASLQPCTPP